MNPNVKTNGKSNAKGQKRGGYKGRPRASKPYTKGKDEEVMDKREGGNDPRWWGTPDYVKSVARFNFSNPLGKPIPFTVANDPTSTVVYSVSSSAISSLPGVMAIDVLPTLGIAKSATDSINTYVRSVFTKLRSTNNQSAPYQAPDLGMYIMAIDSVHMIIEQLVRMYGVARTYSSMNRYMPQAFLSAMGIDPNSSEYNLYSNLADFRAEILNLMLKLQTVVIPKGIHLNERHRELVKYIYLDGNTSKSQCYLFRTKYLYRFEDISDSNGSKLTAVATPIGQSAMRWILLANEMIDRLTTSQFCAIVSGDMIKSFGYENLYKMSFFDEMYAVVPVYNPEILLEIHNMRLAGDRWNDTAFDITQNVGLNEIIAAPYCKSTHIPTGPVFPIIDVPVEDPDPDTVMIATRLVHSGTVGMEDNNYKYVPSAIGTELPLDMVIYYYRNGTLVSVSEDANSFTGASAGEQYRVTYTLESNFDWHPLAYNFVFSGDNPALFSVSGDLSNYTVMSPGDLQKLHEMAVFAALTMIDVDTVGIPNK